MSRQERFSVLDILAASSPWQVQPYSEERTGLTELESFPLTVTAMGFLRHYSVILQEQPRWAVFGLGEGVQHPDFNVMEHTVVRQLPIVAQALLYDTAHFNLTVGDQDLMTSGVLLHDVGEAKTGDVTYDLKHGSNKQVLEQQEADSVITTIDSAGDLDPANRQHLKEAYLRITTSLGEEDIVGLLDGNNGYNKETNWLQLRGLFSLYERYGYLVTAFQMFWPLAFDEGVDQLRISGEHNLAMRWNRRELESAIVGGQLVSEWLKRAILAKNVLLNQWPDIIEAAQHGIPSATHLFGNDLTSRLIGSANNLMGLQLKVL